MTTDIGTHELAMLRSEAAIRRVIEGYADAVTRRDVATYSSMYAPDAVWTIGPPVDQRIEGRDAIVAELTSQISRLDFFVFTVSNIARSRATVHELGRAAEGAPPGLPAMNLRALYDDELRRDGNRWVFAARRYSILYLDTDVPAGQVFPIA